MTTLREINRHWVGIPALALAIIGLGVAGNMAFKRPAESLSQISSAQTNQPGAAMNPNFISDHFLSELRRIPQNAFGSAQPGAQSQKGGKEALSPTASADMAWQPPEEIANQKASRSR